MMKKIICFMLIGSFLLQLIIIKRTQIKISEERVFNSRLVRHKEKLSLKTMIYLQKTENLIIRLIDKIEDNVDDIVEYEEYQLEDAEEVIVAYGSTARSAKTAVDSLRKEGRKVGMFRPITIWPMAAKQIEEISKRVKRISVVEMNMGQYFLEVDRIANKNTEVDKYCRVHGELITPEEIITFIKEG